MFDEGKLNDEQSHFWKTKPAEELYDLTNDRDEVKNLVKSKQNLGDQVPATMGLLQ